MSSEWQKITLGQFAEINPKRTINKNAVVPFIEMAALPTFSRDVIIDDVLEKEFTGGGAKFKNGDTLLARITPCLENGKTALVSCLPQNINGFGSTEFIVLAPRSDIDINYLYYLVRSDEFRNYAISRMEGTSGRQRVPNNAVAQYSFICPPESYRKFIGDFLASLDDRITLLSETNDTLESIAQAIFKSWFVDFDPVRAKLEGRIPEGMNEAVAALFPNSFEESELGLVPLGWRFASVYDIANVIYGAPFASKRFSTKKIGTPLIRIRDLKDEKPGVYTDEIHPKGYLTKPGDIIVGMDGEFRAYLWGGDLAWLNQRVCVFKPVSDISACFVHLSIKPLLAAVEASETATTVIHLGKNDIDRFRVLIPNREVLDAFSDVANSIYEKIVRGKQNIKILSDLRDSLLPRLISGQLRLPEAESAIEEVH